MKRIPYNCIGSGSATDCPHGQMYAHFNVTYPIKVGSNTCRECRCFSHSSPARQEVACTFPKTPPTLLRAYFGDFAENCTHGNEDGECSHGANLVRNNCDEALCPIWKRWKGEAHV